MATIDPDAFLAPRTMKAGEVHSGGHHYLNVAGHRVPVTAAGYPQNSRAIERLTPHQTGRRDARGFTELEAHGRWGQLNLILPVDAMVDIWEFQEKAFLLERAAAALCEADGTDWAAAQEEDRERWRKVAEAVKLAPADSTTWPTEKHPINEPAR